MFKNLIIIFGIGYLFYGVWWSGCIGLVLLYPLCRRDYAVRTEKKRLAMRLEFREALQSMRTAMHAGYAAENAVREAIRDLRAIYGDHSDMVKGFTRMWNELQMQIPAEQVWMNFAARSRVEEIQDFAVIFQTAKRTGGDLITIMDHTEAVIGEKLEVQQEIASMLTARRLEWKIMVLVPLGIVLYMRVAFPEFMESMYGNLPGIVVMSVCLMVFAVAYMWGQKILNIKV